VLECVTENPCIGPTTLIKKIQEKYNIVVPYMRVYYGKEMVVDKRVYYGIVSTCYTHSKLKWKRHVQEAL
jgi:hypothetical protein